MYQMSWARNLLEGAQGKTALVTGSARGIGGETVSLLNQHGCNIVIIDLPSARLQAEELIRSMRFPERAIFVPASVTEWSQLVHAFKEGVRAFGRIDIVVANAGIMESRAVLQVEMDVNGDPVASEEGNNVIDVNLKGALNSALIFLLQ
jgi:NAD(P)-dependent dehydrogenase (short-subunit alcohol dehydrogenase family)